MKKSVYSLVLSDAVVAEVDRLAYRNNTNRSQMINEILAEYVSYVTPEQRIREAFGRVSALLGEVGAIQPVSAPSDTLLSLRSALLYKYNPTVRYSLELYRAPDTGIGELRVSMRTQNSELIARMVRFYRMWDAVETAHIGSVKSHAQEGKYVRLLCPCALHGGEVPKDPERMGELIAAYIRTLDRSMKRFFSENEDPAAAQADISRAYEEFLAGGYAL